MPLDNLPLLPTTVIGSYALPSWQLTALAEIEKGNYGPTDTQEMFDDAVNIAIMDQERAGIDHVSVPASGNTHTHTHRFHKYHEGGGRIFLFRVHKKTSFLGLLGSKQIS